MDIWHTRHSGRRWSLFSVASTDRQSRSKSDTSLLRIAAENYVKQEGGSGWDDVLEWLERTPAPEARPATSATNDRGETALHLVLKKSSPAQRKQQYDVAKKFEELGSDAFRMQDHRGCLPLHNACQDRACGFSVVRALIEAYPAGLGVMTYSGAQERHTPFGWDLSVSVGGHFTEFLQYVVAADVCDSGVKTSTIHMRKRRNKLLSHFKNHVPLNILKSGMLNERTLESTAMVRWLNEMPCKRPVVCSMVLELYLHLVWIVAFIFLTQLYMEDDRGFRGWEPIGLLAFAAVFLAQELFQMYRFVKTNAAVAYWLDFWNWLDLTTCGLVAASAIKFLQNDDNVNIDALLITTGFFQGILLISYLKKTFFAFSKFVSGVIKIFWSLFPFLVISTITIFAFSFMYYVHGKNADPYYDPLPHNSPNPHASLSESFKAVYAPFASGPEGNDLVLDYMFGIVIVIILLNVVIAVVDEAWADATREANKSFWNYRLDLILEKTRGIDEDTFIQRTLCGCFRGLDEFYIDFETAGTTTAELKRKLSLTHREKGVFFCLVIILKSLGFVVLGFPTFGLLWPKFFRQVLFTPPKPKEDEAKVQMDHLTEQVAECKRLVAENDVRLQADMICYRKEVEAVSNRMDKQLELMQRLLLRDLCEGAPRENSSKRNQDGASKENLSPTVEVPEGHACEYRLPTKVFLHRSNSI